jgi:RND family efflux transporter MFP subunit
MKLTRHLAITSVALLALLTSLSCARTEASSTLPAGATVATLTPVAVARASSEPLTREVVLTGEFRPYQVVDLHAKVAGYLKQITVDVGDHVKAGQQLATIEVPEINDDLAHAEAEGRRSAAEIDRAKSEVTRAEASQSLVDLSYKRIVGVNKKEPGLVAQQEIDEALARKRTADAQVAAARAALASATQQADVSKATVQKSKTMVEYARIVAPFSGMITKRFADPGAMIQAGTASQSQAMPVVRLAQVDRLRTVIPVPESIVPQVRVGASVQIRVNSLNKTYTATVSRYTGDVLTNTRTMDAEIDVVNTGLLLRPGMYADVILTLEKRDNAVTVPVQALIARPDKKTVFVVSPQGVVEERKVDIGIQTTAKIEVRTGLEQGEMVVVGNRTELKPGQKVEPKLGS